jgi:Lon protease-like protein
MSVSGATIEPLRNEELAALPVFPLPRVVFFPGSALPLHLFEPRYRAMMEDCISVGPRAMAVALLAPGWESDYEGRPPIHTVAGAGRIVDFERHPDGRFDLVLHGLSRVQLEELPEEGRLYRRARATPVFDRNPHPDAAERLVPDVLGAASSIAAFVRQKHPSFELGVDLPMPPGAIADRLADRLVADLPRRQALLEQADVKVRLALLHDALLETLATIRPPSGRLH